MSHLLELNSIQTCFRMDGKRVRAVDGISMHIDRGEIIGIVGESGSGKSVTMLSMLQLIASPGRVEGGEVYLEGVNDKSGNPVNILKYPANSPEMRHIWSGRISMIFQEPMTSLNPVLTIGYQIQENFMLHALGIKDLEVKDLNLLNGFYVNLEYPLPNGQSVKFLEDNNVYWGNQIEIPGSDRCYGIVADDNYLLVCEYGCGGTEPEIILYRKRARLNR